MENPVTIFQTYRYLQLIFYPIGFSAVFSNLRNDVIKIKSLTNTSLWSAQTIALLAATEYIARNINYKHNVYERAKCIEEINNKKFDLVEDLQFISRITSKTLDVSGMSKLEFQIHYLNCWSARWLVARKINLFARAFSVDAIAWALAELDGSEQAERKRAALFKI